MKKCININDTYRLCFAYESDIDYSFYDVYDEEDNWLGEIPMNEVMDNCIDEENEVYDEDGLEILIEDLLDD